MGTLYLVATPIGNLADITERALMVLDKVELIAAEDTRVALPMLRRFGIGTRVVSYHDDSPESRVNEILDALDSADVAVIADAGMPGISDPGSALVRAAVERGHAVIPIPGASAVIAAAAASGAADQGFIFGGFLPRQAGPRAKRLRELTSIGMPVVLFEAPTRVERLLAELAEDFPDSHVTVGREITKLHEEWLRGTPAELAARVNPRGEIVLVIEPSRPVSDPSTLLDEALTQAFERGSSLREAVDQAMAATGMNRKPVYARALELAKNSSQ